MKALTQTVLMIRPAHFGFNPETASNNKFQQLPDEVDAQEFALKEFDNMVTLLRAHGIDVYVVNDTKELILPDAIFPNNWFSTHEGGYVFTYPMFAPNRRLERREDVLNQLERDFEVNKRYSLEVLESDRKYLEGTGSMVFDREHMLAFACISPRTDVRALDTFGMLSGFKIHYFHASDRNGFPIYHTNVMMAMGKDFVVICMESVNPSERDALTQACIKYGKTIIEIDFHQMEHFAGNMLSLISSDGQPVLIMSEQAYSSLKPEQISKLKSFSECIVVPVPTIEKVGGGSVRCMMAEVFLQKRVV